MIMCQLYDSEVRQRYVDVLLRTSTWNDMEHSVGHDLVKLFYSHVKALWWIRGYYASKGRQILTGLSYYSDLPVIQVITSLPGAEAIIYQFIISLCDPLFNNTWTLHLASYMIIILACKMGSWEWDLRILLNKGSHNIEIINSIKIIWQYWRATPCKKANFWIRSQSTEIWQMSLFFFSSMEKSLDKHTVHESMNVPPLPPTPLSLSRSLSPNNIGFGSVNK